MVYRRILSAILFLMGTMFTLSTHAAKVDCPTTPDLAPTTGAIRCHPGWNAFTGYSFHAPASIGNGAVDLAQARGATRTDAAWTLFELANGDTSAIGSINLELQSSQDHLYSVRKSDSTTLSLLVLAFGSLLGFAAWRRKHVAQIHEGRIAFQEALNA